MEDLWKLTRMDYRIAAIAEESAYAEIVRRYHREESGVESEPPLHHSVPTASQQKK